MKIVKDMRQATGKLRKVAQQMPSIARNASLNHWTITASGGLFYGEDKHTFFGQLKDNSNVNLGVRYSF